MAMVMGIIMAMVMTTVEIKRDAMKKGTMILVIFRSFRIDEYKMLN
jgi:hypothetical protein